MRRSLKAEKKFWSNPKNYHEFDEEYWEWELNNDDLSFSFFKDKIVCEIGCGPFGMIYFIKNAKQRIGVDPLINYYKEIGLVKEKDNLTLLNTSGEVLAQIQNNFIDIVICYNVLDHTEKPENVLSEIYRILKEKKIFYFHCNTIKRIISPFKKLLRIVDRPHPHHFTKNDLKKLLEKSNFEIYKEKFYGISYTPAFIKEKFYRINSSLGLIKEKIGELFIKHYVCLCKKNNKKRSFHLY